MIQEVDQDGDNVIDFTEFLGLMAGRMKEPEKKDEYADAFKVFDRQNTNTVNSEEIQAAITHLGRERNDEVMTVLREHTDKDGNINYLDLIQKILEEVD